MPRVRLTDRLLQTTKPPESGRIELTDEATPGLEFRVTANGARSWRLHYRVKGREGLQRATIGPYPSISLADARRRARAIYDAAKQGVDLPEQEKRAAEDDERSAKRPATVAKLLSRYVEEYCKTNQRRWQTVERMFSAHVEPAIGAKALDEVRRADIVELLDDLQNKKGLNAQVNRIRSQLIAAFNWAVEREFLDVNPAATVKRRKNIEAPRERVLEDKELAAIWKAAAGLSYPSNQLVRLLILTGQRRDEVRCLPWSEIGDDLWTLPAERNKGKRQHEVPLTKAALEVLGGATRLGPFVFSCDAEGKKPYAGMKRLKEILDRESGVTGWTIHDIRRTVATGLGRLGVAQEVIEHILNHSRPTLHKTYNVHAYRDEKRTALEAWARHVEGVVTGKRANVVELAERRQAT